MSDSASSASLRRAIVICAFGYFMDVFDYNVFTILRVPSLTAMGIPLNAQLGIAGHILDAQLLGILSGAFLWGYLGDRFGRLKALYGSIIIYSIATLGCSLVHDPVTYGLLRFFAGFGIAGEIGAATTLISELMSAKTRGWGNAIIAGVGCFGPVFAVLISWVVEWRWIYMLGGLGGLVLLILRMRLAEPALFKKISGTAGNLGSLKLLACPKQALIFISCVLIASVGIYCNWFLNFFSIELSRAVLAPGEAFNQKTCLLIFYIGLGFGHGLSVVISQLLRSRIRALRYFLISGATMTAFYLIAGPHIKFAATTLYLIYLVLGFLSGLWSIAILVAAEHFGTNIRATASTLACNLSRGAIVPVLFVFQGLQGRMGIAPTAALVGAFLYILAFLALSRLRETHGLDLDYVERLEKAS